MRWPYVNSFRPRLSYVAVADRRKTAKNLVAALAARGVDFRVVSWESLHWRLPVSRGTWILTDFDRLSPEEHEFAARFRAILLAAGVRVLNDPRQFRPRGALLRHLHAAGINRFTCWRPADGEWPDRFPAFLRTEAAHRGAFGDLVHNRSEAQERLTEALAAGHVLADLLFIEYAAEPLPETGRFQKHAAYRIGDTILRGITVNDASWHAKHGTRNSATEEQYRSELAEVDTYPHEAWVRRVFDLAGIEFGRVDFALVGGVPQAYEINTNPTMSLDFSHPSEARRASLERLGTGLVDRLAAIATGAQGGRVRIRAAGNTGMARLGSLRRP